MTIPYEKIGTNTYQISTDGHTDIVFYASEKLLPAEEYPDRFFNVGIAESNLVGVASGMATSGKTPLAASFACFLLYNAYDQIRMSVAFPRANVKLVGSHRGISIGEDGPSQMAIEDIALATSLAVVTAEEHLLQGGLSSAVARVVTQQHPVPMQMVGIDNEYAKSGAPQDLLAKYGLMPSNIVSAARDVLERKA
jgi:transketolase C-terminal domain/subunit